MLKRKSCHLRMYLHQLPIAVFIEVSLSRGNSNHEKAEKFLIAWLMALFLWLILIVHPSFIWELVWDVEKWRIVTYMTGRHQSRSILAGLATSVMMVRIDRTFRGGCCPAGLNTGKLIIPSLFEQVRVKHKFTWIIRNPQI